MASAAPILREKVIDEGGNLVELVICRVPATGEAPASVRYRLAFIRRGERMPAVLYDNHRPKGHHRHLGGIEQPYAFMSVEQLLADFIADVRRVTGDRTWPRR